MIVDKPAGMTSHDVVVDVRQKLATKRVGHGGTLDPDATGVLVVGVGKTTRLLEFAQRAPKRYRASARFGVTTTTQDSSGEVVRTRPVTFERRDLESAIGRFDGVIEQVPPMVSAVKVGGERLYRKARRGEHVERAARKVTVYEIRLVDFKHSGDDAIVELDIACSAGTYVRTLVHDVGERLGSGAHLTSLRRTASGGFDERDALPLEEVDRRCLRPPGDIVRDLARVEVTGEELLRVRNGRPISRPEALPGSAGDPVAVFTGEDLVAVYRVQGDELLADKVLGL